MKEILKIRENESHDVLVSFSQLAQSKAHLRRGNVNWKIAFIRLAVDMALGLFSWIQIYEEEPSPLWTVLSLGR